MRRGGRLGGLWDAEGIYRLVDELKPKLGARGEVVKIPVRTLAQAVIVLMLTADELDPNGGKPRAPAP